MPAVIIYMSLHGCTEKAAVMLKEMSWKEVDLVNLRDTEPPDLENYTTVIVGGSIHIGSIQPKIRKFCNDHESELLTKRLGLYLCHMSEGEVAIRQFRDTYSEKLRDHAVAKGLFGGELNLERMNVRERDMIKKTAGIDKSVKNMDIDAIRGFGRVIFHLDKC